MLPDGLTERIASLMGQRGYLDRPEDLALYEYDGSQEKHRPGPGGVSPHHGGRGGHREARG
jgi:hypothetical protein